MLSNASPNLRVTTSRVEGQGDWGEAFLEEKY
jgi:hypothetical protein